MQKFDLEIIVKGWGEERVTGKKEAFASLEITIKRRVK
jgi:hypothetical protein